MLLDLMFSLNLSQIVTELTRVQGTTSNMLDLVFLSHHFPLDQTKLEFIDGISDHKITLCVVPVQNTTFSCQPRITYLDFSRADNTSITDYLSYEFTAFEELSIRPTSNIEMLFHSFKVLVFHCVSNMLILKLKKRSTTPGSHVTSFMPNVKSAST